MNETIPVRIDRRNFIRTAGAWSIVVAGIPMLVTACAGSSSTMGASETYQSSTVGGHFHDFSIPDDDFTAPPSNGLSGPTTTNSGHSHLVALSQAQLSAIESGQTVTVETTSTQGHTHGFTFTRNGGTPSGGGGGGGGY